MRPDHFFTKFLTKHTMQSKAAVFCIILISVCGLTLISAQADNLFWVGKFSACRPGGDFPPGWEPLTFKKIDRHTRYELVRDGHEVVVKAISDASSSGLIRKLTLDLEHFPIISWRWKIFNTYTKGDASRKQGDDYPARIYVTFAYDPEVLGFADLLKYKTAKLIYGEYPPGSAVTYIWANRTPAGAILPNPYTERVRMIAVQSGNRQLNRWIQEERNLYQDYQAAFGTRPPLISGVAIMTDSDDTREAATAYYGDIVFKRR